VDEEMFLRVSAPSFGKEEEHQLQTVKTSKGNMLNIMVDQD
jgi:hypothetical protein